MNNLELFNLHKRWGRGGGGWGRVPRRPTNWENSRTRA